MYRAFGVPWLKEDDHERLRSMTRADFAAFRQGRASAMMRWNGSPFYPAKVPDLIGIKERKYLDHTATALASGNRRSDAMCRSGDFRRRRGFRSASRAFGRCGECPCKTAG